MDFAYEFSTAACTCRLPPFCCFHCLLRCPGKSLTVVAQTMLSIIYWGKYLPSTNVIIAIVATCWAVFAHNNSYAIAFVHISS